MKRTPLGLFAPMLLFASVAAGQDAPSPSIEALSLPTYVTQLGKTHFPFKSGSHYDVSDAVVALPSGAVVIAGRSNSSIGEPHAGSNTWPDVFVARFDPVGRLEWIQHFGSKSSARLPALHGDPDGPGGKAIGYDYAADLAVAPDGSIYVTGSTSSSLGETKSGSGYDMFLAKFDAQGSLQWFRQLGKETKSAFTPTFGYPLALQSDSHGESLLVDPSGAVYVAGWAEDDLAEPNGTDHDEIFQSDVFLARFSADGRLEWVRQMGEVSSYSVGFDPARSDYSAKIALHPSGTIVMACTSESWTFDFYGIRASLLTFDARGTPLAAVTVPGSDGEFVNALATDPASGRIFVAGHSFAGGAFVASFDGDLLLEWLGPEVNSAIDLGFSAGKSVYGLCVDTAGDLVLAGTTGSSLSEPNGGEADVFTAKLHGSDGVVSWVSQIGKTTSALHGLDAKRTDYALDLALGPRDTIVLTGSTEGNLAEPNAGDADVIVIRLNPDGSL